MKHSILYLSLFFLFFNQNTHAQDSKGILSLKNKLTNAKTESEQLTYLVDIGNMYSQNNSVDSALVYVKKYLPIYESQNNIEQIGRTNLFMAKLYFNKNDIVSGEKYVVVAEKNLDQTENYDKRAQTYYFLATVNSINKKDKIAAEYCNKIVKLYQQNKIKDKRIVLSAYQRLFQNSFAQENAVAGFNTLNTYIDFTKSHFPEYLYEAYVLAGTFYLTNKDFNKALDFFKKALEAAKRNKNETQMATAKMLIGDIYTETKQFDIAKTYLNEAKTYFEDKKINESLKLIYYYLSDVNYKQKDYPTAKQFIDKTLKLVNENDMMYNYFKHQKGLIDLKYCMDEKIDIKNDSSKRKELQNLINEQTKLLNYFSGSKTVVFSEIFIQNYEILHEAYGKLGDYEKSYEYLKKYNEIYEKTYSLEKMQKLSETQSKYELTIEKARIKLEEETKRISLQKEIELKALRFEYEKKQATAKSAEEKKLLLLEENSKRKEIQLKYNLEQKALSEKYNQEKKVTQLELESSKNLKNMWAVGAGLSLLLFGFAGYSYNQKRKDNKKIAEEKQKSDDLLLNILPYEVAEELKQNGKTNAKHYDEVSVLFTDFVNFTSISEQIGVQEMLNELNICFTEFDRIMGKYDLEKIKTIGDAYLAVSGLPVSNALHAKNAVHAAIEILNYIEKRKSENPNALDIRIGIHSGAVIAGIVGVKKFAYDIWGDTVNTAARMEQNSQPGKLNVSEATYTLLKDDFVFEHRGKIVTKGKGELNMYFYKEIPS